MEAESSTAVLQCFLDLDNFDHLLTSSSSSLSSQPVTFDCSTAQDDAIVIYDKYVWPVVPQIIIIIIICTFLSQRNVITSEVHVFSIYYAQHFLTVSPPIPLRLYTSPHWYNPPSNCWHSGTLALRVPECQKLKIVGYTSVALISHWWWFCVWRYFSLQATGTLRFDDGVRQEVERNICSEDGVTTDCFTTPRHIIYCYIERVSTVVLLIIVHMY